MQRACLPTVFADAIKTAHVGAQGAGQRRFLPIVHDPHLEGITPVVQCAALIQFEHHEDALGKGLLPRMDGVGAKNTALNGGIPATERDHGSQTGKWVRRHPLQILAQDGKDPEGSIEQITGHAGVVEIIIGVQ